MPVNLNKIYLKLVAVMLFWGTAFISGRTLSLNYHPFSVAFVRFFLASIILITILYFKNKNFYKITFTQFLKVLFLGMTGVFSYNYFFFSGLKLVEAGRSSIIVATNPAFTTLFAYIFLKEDLTKRKILGLLFAVFGALVVITKGNISTIFSTGIGQGELYLFFAVLSWVSYTIFGKVALKKMTALEASTFASFIGAVILLPFALNQDVEQMFSNATLMDWFHVANLGVFSTCFGFIWYYDGVKNIGAARASSFINLIPLFGITSGVIFLNETIDTSLILGGILVIIGVYLINRAKKLAIK